MFWPVKPIPPQPPRQSMIFVRNFEIAVFGYTREKTKKLTAALGHGRYGEPTLSSDQPGRNGRFTITAAYLVWNSAGSATVEGIQGRYFLPLLALRERSTLTPPIQRVRSAPGSPVRCPSRSATVNRRVNR